MSATLSNVVVTVIGLSKCVCSGAGQPALLLPWQLSPQTPVCPGGNPANAQKSFPRLSFRRQAQKDSGAFIRMPGDCPALRAAKNGSRRKQQPLV
jgi:hypothetical protein